MNKVGVRLRNRMEGKSLHNYEKKNGIQAKLGDTDGFRQTVMCGGRVVRIDLPSGHTPPGFLLLFASGEEGRSHSHVCG